MEQKENAKKPDLLEPGVVLFGSRITKFQTIHQQLMPNNQCFKKLACNNLQRFIFLHLLLNITYKVNHAVNMT
jgi:hypothetical protein